MLDIDYRFNLEFILSYTNKKNITSKKKYSFFARKTEMCEFSGMTINCDEIFLKKKIVKFYRYKNFISFKLKFIKASNLLIKDLKKNSENLISYIRPKIENNKNILRPHNNSISNLEKYYRNCKKFNFGKKNILI